MAIQLPKYQRQVGTVSGIGAQQAIDPNAALAPVRAMGKAIDVTTDMGIEFAKRLKKHKVEGEIAGYKNDASLLDDRIELAKQQARAEGVSDEEIMDKAVMPTLDAFYAEQREKGMSKDAMTYADADFGIKTQSVYLKEQGELLERTITRSNLQKVELAINMAGSDIDGANKIIDGLEDTAKPEHVSRWREDVNIASEMAEKERARSAEKQRNFSLTADTMRDPVGTLEKINTQRAGGEQFYDVEPEALKAAKSEAKAEIARRQTEAADTLYDKDSDYRKLNVTDKIDILDKLRDSGAISAKTYKREFEDAVEPNTVDVTPQNNIDWVNATAKIRKAGQDPVKQAQVLDEIGGMGFPQKMKADLYSFSKDVLDPMSSYNKGRSEFAFDQMDTQFGNVLAEDFILPWGKEKKSFIEKRDEIIRTAQYEAEIELTEWLRTDGADASRKEIQRKVNDTMIDINDKYNLKNYSELLDTITELPDTNEAGEVDDGIANDYIEQRRKNR